MYYVWRRNDGYVSVGAAKNHVTAKRHCESYRTKDGTVSFEILLETANYNEARKLVEDERAKANK